MNGWKAKKKMKRRATKEGNNCQVSLMGCGKYRQRRNIIQFSLPLTDCGMWGQISDHKKIISKRKRNRDRAPAVRQSPLAQMLVWNSRSCLCFHTWFHYHPMLLAYQPRKLMEFPVPATRLHSFALCMYHSWWSIQSPLVTSTHTMGRKPL